MPEEKLNLAVIVASTREGRFADTVARWFLEQARPRVEFRIDPIDLLDIELPQTIPGNVDPRVGELARRIERADAFVVLTPEYNHSYPAALKHAIDLVHGGWKAKPVAFVSYGGISGGLRAVEHLRGVFAELHAVTLRDGVSFHGTGRSFGSDGEPREPSGCNAAAKKMLDQLSWWGGALRQARRSAPYPGR